MHSTMQKFITLFGRLTNAAGTAVIQNVELTSNAICFLFDEIRYELNGIEIDRCKYVGQTSTMKNYIFLTPNQQNVAENAGWLEINTDTTLTLDGYYDVTIPLNMIFGSAEDYKKIIVNAKHELILTRSRTALNAIFHDGHRDVEEFKISLEKVEWMVPYLLPADNHKIKMLEFIEKDPLILISFRSWEIYEYPLVPVSTKVVWQIKTSTQLEKPRYVILGFQTGRKFKLKLRSKPICLIV